MELLGITCFTEEIMMNYWTLAISFVVPMVKYF